MKIRIITGIIAGAALLSASVAYAQSTVSGTLTGGGSASTTITGTVGGGSTLTGTVTSTSTTGGGSTGGGGGGGGGGTNIVDICPNIAGDQATLPAGYVIQGGNCIASTGSSGGTTGGTTGGGGVLGASTGPNVPNTGSGGDAADVLMTLTLSGLAAALGGTYLLLRRRQA